MLGRRLGDAAFGAMQATTKAAMKESWRGHHFGWRTLVFGLVPLPYCLIERGF